MIAEIDALSSPPRSVVPSVRIRSCPTYRDREGKSAAFMMIFFSGFNRISDPS